MFSAGRNWMSRTIWTKDKPSSARAWRCACARVKGARARIDTKGGIQTIDLRRFVNNPFGPVRPDIALCPNSTAWPSVC